MRSSLLPYGRQSIDDADVAAVVDVLRSEWLTTGPLVEEFERRFAQLTDAREAVAVSSGTAALHASMYAIGIGPGDEVIVPAMTFAASANCVVYQGGTPVFVDVQTDTLLIDPAAVERRIGPATRAIVPVDYAGQPCDYDALHDIARRHRLAIVADSCHALGADYRGRRVGTLADVSTFSLHPVKHVTTGEGGVVTTDDPELAQRMRTFRNHGITTDHRQRQEQGSWFYDMVDLGYNYRITDFQCALGVSQIKKLPEWRARRQEIAGIYDEEFRTNDLFHPLHRRDDRSHAYHLYVVRLAGHSNEVDRTTIFRALRAEGIGVNVHYVPIHLHSFYRTRFGTRQGDCPVAEEAYEQILSLPIFHAMTDGDVNDVLVACRKILDARELVDGSEYAG